MTEGNGTMRTLEETLRTTAETQNAKTDDVGFGVDLSNGLHDPSDAGVNAAWSIAELYKSAQHVREMGQDFLKFAQAVDTKANELAAEFEAEASALHKMLEAGRAGSAEILKFFEEQRERLAAFRPGRKPI